MLKATKGNLNVCLKFANSGHMFFFVIDCKRTFFFLYFVHAVLNIDSDTNNKSDLF